MKFLCFFLFVLLGGGGEHSNKVVRIDDGFVIVEFELFIGIIDFLAGEFVTEGHEHRSEFLGVDFTGSLFESSEGGGDDFILVGFSGGFASEHVYEGGEVKGSSGVTEHLLEFLVGGNATDFVENASQVRFVDDTVSVAVHELETFLEFSDLFLGEHVEDGRSGLLGLFGA